MERQTSYIQPSKFQRRTAEKMKPQRLNQAGLGEAARALARSKHGTFPLSWTFISGAEGVHELMQAKALVITHIFLCERLARLEALGPKPRRGWPVYSNVRAPKTANPVGVTCARCKIVGPEKHLSKPLDWTWVRSPLRGLASVVTARDSINRPPPPGFGDSVASGLAATRPARAMSASQASSQQLWVMARAKACAPGLRRTRL
jgi:hypothetical protein